MCYFPRNIYNPARKVYNHGGHQWFLSVPCGRCEECERLKSDEYYFRSWYESQYCIDNGGYVYFDTLTYNDESLPHCSDFTDLIDKGSALDFPCFCPEHIRLFLVHLRVLLNRAGYNPKGCLKYFLTCEYGTDPLRTHRPHYHVNFYVSDGSIPPLVLSDKVGYAWKHGITDGVKYKGVSYVKNHIFGKSFCDYDAFDAVYMRNVCNYVAKYVVKDSEFMEVVNSRFDFIRTKLMSCGHDKSSIKDVLRELSKRIFPFHRQSSFYGSEFLRYNNIEDIDKYGVISIPDAKQNKRSIPLPTYYKRKLYYDLVVAEDGTKHWQLNEKGIKHSVHYASKLIENNANRFLNWYNNLHTYLGKDGTACAHQVDELLNGRSFSDFSAYLLFYRGRIVSSDIYDSVYKDGVAGLPPLDEQIKIVYSVPTGTPFRYHYCTSKDVMAFGSPVVSVNYLGSSIEGYKPLSKGIYNCSEKEFGSKFLIYDWMDSRFSGFDRLFSLYVSSLEQYRHNKESSYRNKKRFNRLMRSSFVSAVDSLPF